jgi:hypothetical protein
VIERFICTRFPALVGREGIEKAQNTVPAGGGSEDLLTSEPVSESAPIT